MINQAAQMTIAVLRPLADATSPQFYEAAHMSLDTRLLLASFVDCGFVDGVYRRDQNGRPSDFMNLTISVSGRRHFADVQMKEEDKTSMGYLKNRAPKIIAWFFGILASVLVVWLIKSYL